MAQENSRKDIYQTITDQIVGMLEQGVKPWSQSWEGANLALPLRYNEGYQHSFAVGFGNHAGLHQAALDDLQTGASSWRMRSQRRKRNIGGLCQFCFGRRRQCRL